MHGRRRRRHRRIFRFILNGKHINYPLNVYKYGLFSIHEKSPSFRALH